MTIRAYFAGPLFTHAERTWNTMLAEAIQNATPGIEVFLPQAQQMGSVSN